MSKTTMRSSALKVREVLASYGDKKVRGKIVQADALTFLKSLTSESADLVFLDPPFNLGKLYSSRNRDIDRKPEEEYSRWLEKIVSESGRVLVPGGALYLYHLPKWAMLLGSVLVGKSGLKFLHWIAISMKNGFVRGERLYPAHYALLLFTKGRPKIFNRPKIEPTKCRHCDRLIKDYGGYRSIIERQGINLSDFWDDLSPVRHANRKNRKANELPQLLFSRVMGISGIDGGVYVDPFLGSGSGIVAAVRAGMRFYGCDLLRSIKY